MESNYKELSNIISKHHNKNGITIHPIFKAIENHSIINLSNEETIVSFTGKDISPKKIRKFLWENKKDRRFQRETAILWTSYNEETDTSFLGVGANTKPEVSSRLNAEVLWEQTNES